MIIIRGQENTFFFSARLPMNVFHNLKVKLIEEMSLTFPKGCFGIWVNNDRIERICC